MTVKLDSSDYSGNEVPGLSNKPIEGVDYLMLSEERDDLDPLYDRMRELEGAIREHKADKTMLDHINPNLTNDNTTKC